MLDKSLPYLEFLMERKSGSPIPEFDLNEGYEFVHYTKGDEKHWANIETSVLEFDKVRDARKYFKKNFYPFQDELKRRCYFVRCKKTKEYVATATIWWDYIDKRRNGWLHWIAVKPQYQGLGIAKAIIGYCVKNAIEIEGDVQLYLHTQTWSYSAINIYRKFGFNFMTEPKIGRWDNSKFGEAYKIIEEYLR